MSRFFSFWSSADFMPHGGCYLWRPEILWLNVGADAAIAAAYLSIPFALWTFVRRRTDLEFRWVFHMFAAFIFWCAMTHVAEIWVVWDPYYGIQGVIKAITAVISVTTAAALWPLIPKVLALPSPAQLRQANEALLAERDLLDVRVAERTAALEKANVSAEAVSTEIEIARQRLAEALEAMRDGFALFDADGRLIICNSSYRTVRRRIANLLEPGADMNELARAAARQRVDEGIEPDVESGLRRTRVAHDNLGVPMDLRLSSGLWIRRLATKTRDGGTIDVWSDITNLKVAQESLEEQAEALKQSNVALAESNAVHRRLASDLQAVIHTAVDGIIIIDEGGIVETFNPACAGLFGYEPHEVLGRNVKILMPDHYAAEHDQYLTNYKMTGVAKVIGIGREVVGRRKDGSEFPMALSVGEIRSGDVTRFVGIIHDITEIKVAQQQLEAQARELTRSNQELEQFAYLASHDMQEPLRVIASYCDLLRRRYADRLDQDGREFIDYAVDGATRMRSLIDDLLIYSRVGREELTTEPVSLSKALGVSLQGLRRIIEENGATVTTDGLPTVRGNSVMLAQVFQNLVGNGIKFHGEAPPAVHVGCTKQGDEWVVSVTDNGIGIAPEFAEQVFGMFRRLHGRSEYPGNGLGLALCKRIVERHDGRIWIEPGSGPGTTICFTLPWTAGLRGSTDKEDTAIDRSTAV